MKSYNNRYVRAFLLCVIPFLVLLTFLNYIYQIYTCYFEDNNLEESDFRVMTYNIQMGAHDSTILRENIKDTLINVIKYANPDIVCLQECTRWHIRGFDSILKQHYPHVAHGYNMYSKYEVVKSFVIVTDTLSDRCSDLKLKNQSLFNGSKNTGIFYCADINIKGRIVRIINVRLASNNISTMPELPIYAKAYYGYKNYLFGSKLRQIQINAIEDSIKSSPYPIILCGDMNDISGSSSIKLLTQNGLEDAWWHSGLGYGATYSDHAMHLRIDHVLYDKGLIPLHSQVIELEYSDHLPLIVDFKYNQIR